MRWLLSFLAVAWVSTLTAQPLYFGYYEVDRLYDTLPSPFYDDSDFTPQGRYRWTTERYREKIARVAATIDSMRLHAVALYGVENEAVVRDLAATLQGDYTYLHRTLNSYNGLEFALLYEGDRIIPLQSRAEGRSLYIEALFDRDTVGILLCNSSRSLPYILERIRNRRPNLPLIVAGQADTATLRHYNLIDRMAEPERKGYGTRRTRSGWVMQSRIATDTRLGHKEGGIYLRRELLDERLEYPAATFIGRRYIGGAGRSLPLFVEIDR